MLAQNFKTAADLELSESEFRALVTVLGMLERGEIVREKFTMATTGDPFWMKDKRAECGTPACICGWARHVATDKVFENDGYTFNRRTVGLQSLFIMGHSGIGAPHDHRSPQEAAIALRNYLTVGEPRWGESLAHAEGAADS